MPRFTSSKPPKTTIKYSFEGITNSGYFDDYPDEIPWDKVRLLQNAMKSAYDYMQNWGLDEVEVRFTNIYPTTRWRFFFKADHSKAFTERKLAEESRKALRKFGKFKVTVKEVESLKGRNFFYYFPLIFLFFCPKNDYSVKIKTVDEQVEQHPQQKLAGAFGNTFLLLALTGLILWSLYEALVLAGLLG